MERTGGTARWTAFGRRFQHLLVRIGVDGVKSLSGELDGERAGRYALGEC
jgi:hypothetical protein